ncbi:MAG TPA: S9 family peptidase [Thermomicrobiaceae bacterium]|nr:S9 family peptidase [Thermomicrobiaceae bacterium]
MTGSATPTEAQPLTPEQVVSWTRPGDARISPDGERVAFARKPVSKAGEHPESSIWLLPFGAGAPRRFSGGLWNDDAPRWSPDGSRLAFLSDRAERGKQSVYLMPVGGGEARRVFEQQGELSELAWSPGGRYLSVLLTEPETEEEKKRKEERDDAHERDADWKFRRLWLIDLTGEAEAEAGAYPPARVISPEARQVWGYAWSPDSARLAIDTTASPVLDEMFRPHEVALVEVDGGEPRPLFALQGSAHDLTWSPAGDRLAYLAPAARVVHGEYVYARSLDGDEPVCLTPDFAGTGDFLGRLGDELLLLAYEGVDAVLYRLSWDGMRSPLLAHQPAGRVSPPVTVSTDGRRIALVREDATHAPNIWVADLSKSPPELTQRTHFHPELEEAALGEPEVIRWTSDEGVEVEGILFKPHGYQAGQRYPLVVQVHGGPTHHWSNQFAATWHDWAHYLAGRGYAVLLPNPRGSTGRGPDYSNAIFGDVGGGEYRDMMSGVDHLIATGLADPERLGVGGWSWGGYMTAWTVSQTGRFKAAVMGAGLANMVSDNSLGDIPTANLSYFDESPYRDPLAYFERSAIRYIHQASTPTLILHGEEDKRVHPSQGAEMYVALRTLGVPVRFVTYPREGHGIQERKHQLDLIQRVGDWYDQHVRSLQPSTEAGAAKNDISQEV